MRKTIDAKHISEMAASLENDELGGAIRLLSRILSTGRAVPVTRARIVTQMDETSWDASAPAILDFFDIVDSEVTHVALRDTMLPAVSSAPRERAGTTGDLPIVSPTRQQVVPSYPARSAPEKISIKQAAYETMVRMCAAAHQSENTARAALASLLKTWPEGDVYDAVYQCDRQGFVADPRSWIMATLKAKSRPVVRHRAARNEVVAAPTKKHRLSTPDALGVSQSTADKIRERNRGLGLNLDASKGADA